MLKKSLDLENQLDKTNSALSKIVNLEEQVQEKEKKLSELQSDFKIQMSEIKNKELKSQETLQKREKLLKIFIMVLKGTFK